MPTCAHPINTLSAVQD